ncbi:MAG: hypothetical protein SAL07_13035 [Oscillatoria sp. PMC 1051.18]|nr:hypothetical protein [Oscillatoria sp. PMC 1050.18]MEC5030816.1 hypothetical protein [Oscillatoria sp. PMC 1051.18]
MRNGAIRATVTPKDVNLGFFFEKIWQVIAKDIVWEYLLNITVRSSEPRIYEKRDRYGKTYWQVYDPVTNFCYSFDSENEVRIWLERRYYSK